MRHNFLEFSRRSDTWPLWGDAVDPITVVRSTTSNYHGNPCTRRCGLEQIPFAYSELEVQEPLPFSFKRCDTVPRFQMSFRYPATVGGCSRAYRCRPLPLRSPLYLEDAVA